MKAARLTAILGVTLLALSSAAAAAAPKTSVTAIEAEVMCPICGTLLELAESPQAQREKVYVARLVKSGKSKAEIKDALVAQYGPDVLALPKASGFNLSAYLVPAIAVIVAILMLAFSVSHWRREGRRNEADRRIAAPRGEEAERLEADLNRYDL